MQKADNWADLMAFYRFWNNEKVTEAGLIDCAVGQCNEYIKDIQEVLLIQDTTDVNMEKHRWRITDTSGLGVIGNDYNNLGFLYHPGLLVNPADKSVIGLADILLYGAGKGTSTRVFARLSKGA
jgi:hypothetical protein